MSEAASLEALADAARALAGELGLDRVLETIVDAAMRLTDARYGALGVIGEDEQLSRFVHRGFDEETVAAIGPHPRGKGILGVIIRDPQPLRLDDLEHHAASYGFPPNHPPMHTFLGVPIRSGGRVFGNLYLTEKQGGFTEDDERLVIVLAAQAGAAIENAMLSERLRTLAVQDERDRLARELHDGVIQTLFSIGMGLEAARAQLETAPDRASERIETAVDGLDGAIRELRNSIFELQPARAAAKGLTGGLVELAREFEVNALVRPRLDIPPEVDAHVEPSAVPDLLQVIREALTNAAKHAKASTVTVAMHLTGRSLVVEVIDDGAGFDVRAPRVGRGLGNIRERTELLGAALDVESAVGGGTTVRIVVPVDGGVA